MDVAGLTHAPQGTGRLKRSKALHNVSSGIIQIGSARSVNSPPMCGRYDLSDNPAAIKAKFRVPSVPDFAPNPDIRPTQRQPIVRLGRDQTPESVLARWGLVPAWAKDLKFGTRCINARAETVASLPAFRHAFAKRRCLVPLNAFYEWSGPVGSRTKWRIRLREENLFALGGLWEWWRDPATQEGIETFTIVTCAPNAAIARIHDRMPVILDMRDYEQWLDAAADAAPLLVPASEERIVMEPS